jgi:hypothetical protein
MPMVNITIAFLQHRWEWHMRPPVQSCIEYKGIINMPAGEVGTLHEEDDNRIALATIIAIQYNIIKILEVVICKVNTKVL